MLLITDFNTIPSINTPCGLTIGSFDGVHLGHQALLHHLKSQLPSDGILTVFTFSNHPSSLFAPHAPVPLICPVLQKVQLLKDHGAEIIFLIPFTYEFSQLPFEFFLQKLKNSLKFSHLVLGAGASFGKGREGHEMNVRHVGEKLSFTVNYFPKTTVEGTAVSSGRIRSLIAQGSLHEIQKCLGRPYSLISPVYQENGLHYFSLPNICFLPKGDYRIRLKTKSAHYLTKAHVSPKEQKVYLDLLHTQTSFQDENVEIIFID